VESTQRARIASNFASLAGDVAIDATGFSSPCLLHAAVPALSSIHAKNGTKTETRLAHHFTATKRTRFSIAAPGAEAYVRPRRMAADTHGQIAPSSEEERRNRRHFLLRRLHSLSGVVPVGAFLCVHLWTNAKAVQGATCFGKAVEEINHLPFLPVIEVFGILAPLLFHAIYGVVLAFQSQSNVGEYGYGRNWLFTLQRITGVLAFLFILMHLNDFFVVKMLGKMHYDAFFTELGNMLSVRWKALVYLFGTTAAVFHFANGIRTFLFGWGVTVSARSQRHTAIAVTVLGSILWLLGANTIVFFSTGGGGLVPTSALRGEHGRDLCESVAAPLPAASH
jgi:succinate dehydrogenase / fumarate reductase cytochrome b subunit